MPPFYANAFRPMISWLIRWAVFFPSKILYVITSLCLFLVLMDDHLQYLQLVCRFGGGKLSATSKGVSYLVSDHYEAIQDVLGIDVSKDDPDIHPLRMCSTCERAITKAYTSRAMSSGGCGFLVTWTAHTRKGCAFCEENGRKSKGGRPKKSVGGLPLRPSFSECDSLSENYDKLRDESSAVQHSSGMDIPIVKLYDISTPKFKHTADSLLERFTQPFSELQCPICLHVADQAVQSACRTHLFCTTCISYWLQASSLCPLCRSDALASTFLAPNRIVRGILSSCMLSCDFYESSWSGCSSKVQLKDLRDHVACCPHNPHATEQPPPRVVSTISTVGDMLTACPRKLQGDVGDKALSHIVKSRAVADRLEVKTGGRPQVWTRTPVPLVDSKDASASTLKRRISYPILSPSRASRAESANLSVGKTGCGPQTTYDSTSTYYSCFYFTCFSFNLLFCMVCRLFVCVNLSVCRYV